MFAGSRSEWRAVGLALGVVPFVSVRVWDVLGYLYCACT